MNEKAYKMYLILKNVKWEEDSLWLTNNKKISSDTQVDVKIVKNMILGARYNNVPIFSSPIYYIQIKKFQKIQGFWKKTMDVEYEKWEDSLPLLSEIYYSDLSFIDKLKWKLASIIVYFYNFKIGWKKAKECRGGLKYKLYVANKIAKLLMNEG